MIIFVVIVVERLTEQLKNSSHDFKDRRDFNTSFLTCTLVTMYVGFCQLLVLFVPHFVYFLSSLAP